MSDLDGRTHSGAKGKVSTWSDPARHAATLAEILEALGRAILADEVALRRRLAHVETLRARVCLSGRDRHSDEADEQWEAIGNALYEAGEAITRIRETMREAREVRGRLARAREAAAEPDIVRAAEARRVAATHMAADRATLTVTNRKARRVEAARVAALTPDEAQAEAWLAKLQGRTA